MQRLDDAGGSLGNYSLTVYNHPASVQHQRPRGQVHPLRQCQNDGGGRCGGRENRLGRSAFYFFRDIWRRSESARFPWTRNAKNIEGGSRTKRDERRGAHRDTCVVVVVSNHVHTHLEPVFLCVAIAGGFLHAVRGAPQARKHPSSSTFSSQKSMRTTTGFVPKAPSQTTDPVARSSRARTTHPLSPRLGVIARGCGERYVSTRRVAVSACGGTVNRARALPPQ